MIATTLAGAAAAAVLVVLPGAWIAFGLPLAGAPAWLRLCTGCALSPFALFVQYYPLRWLGLSFDSSLLALVGLNLLALPLVWRGIRPLALPSRSDVLGSAALLAVPLACLLLPALLQPGDFPWWLHSWMHASTIYELAGGQLIPEEARLAGLSQSYPWAAHLFQALVSRALDRPPTVTYLGFNAVCMLVTTFLAGGLARELGGGRRARALTWILLWFGINALGYLLRAGLLPAGWESRHLFHGHIFGDVQYTPWLWKFRFLEHIVLALPMFAALPHFLLRAWRPGGAAADLALVAVLLCGVTVVYPILAAAAFGLVAGCALLLAAVRRWDGELVPRARAWQLAALLLACGVIGAAYFQLLVIDRHHGTGGISGPREMARKTLQAAIVTAPLLAAALLHLRATWSGRPRAAAILATGALASLALNVVCRLPAAGNEYKFIFTAGICLAPFAGVVLERLLARSRRTWPAALLLVCLVLAAPFALKIRGNWGYPPGDKPALDLSGFDLRFAPSVPGASVYAAIRASTPADTVLAVDAPPYEMTALTSRALYAPESHARIVPGVMIGIEHLLIGLKGYDPEVVRRRREICRALFRGDEGAREGALAAIRALGRPVAILIETGDPEHAELLRWLQQSSRGRLLARDPSFAAWLADGVGP